MPPFSGPPFALETVTPYTNLTLRVKFTQDPRQISASGPTDGLNPSNYTLSGPIAVTITQINTVVSNTQLLDVVIAAPLIVGQWTLTVANIVSDVGDPLTSPTSISFDITDLSLATPLNNGASNYDEIDLLRQHLNQAFKGDGWDAILEGLGAGDHINNENAQLIFDQLFKSTAGGIYLDRKCSDSGLIRPPGIGMSDDSFRQYAIKHTNEKLTFKSLWELMEVFYGSDSVRGWMTTSSYEPYALSDGDDLQLLVDETNEVNVTFNAQDFDAISAAKSLEIATVINQAFDKYGVSARALAYLDPETGSTQLKIYSNSLGLRSFIRVVGGKAQNILQFPTFIDAFTGTAIAWTISVDDLNVVRFTTTSALVDLSLIQIDDFVNINSLGLTIDGSYPILDIGYSSITGTQWFVVGADSIPDPSGVFNQTLASEIIFHRPVKNDIFTNDRRNVSIVATTPNTLNISIPATTQIINRTPGTGAYNKLNSPFDSVNIYGPHNVVRVNVGAHNLTTSDRILIQNFKAGSSLPSDTAAKTWSSPSGTCTVNPMRIWDNLHDSADLNLSYGGVVLNIGNNKALIAGGYDFTGLSLNTVAQELQITGPTAGVVSYTWGTATNIPQGTFNCSGVSLTNSVAFENWGVVIGGDDGLGTALDDVQAYDPNTSTWINHTEAPLINGRYGHSNVLLNDGSIFVAGGANGGGAIAQSEIITPNDSGTWQTNAAANLPTPRSYGQMVKLSDGRVLFVGGFTGFLLPQNKCHIYNPTTNTWTETGPMSYNRMFHGTVLLPDGKVIVIGGNGYKSTLPSTTTPVALNQVEVWDPDSGRWYPFTSTNYTHLFTTALYNAYDENVYVIGSNYAESLDLVTKQWRKVIRTRKTLNLGGFATAQIGENIVTFGGADLVTSVCNIDTDVIIPGETSLNSKGINGEHAVTGIGGTYVTISNPQPGYVSSVASPETQVYEISSTANSDIPGPYILSPDEGVSVTGVYTLLTQDLIEGQKYSKINVVDASDFPDTAGWVVLNFGQTSSSGAIRYLGKYSNTEIILDYNTPIPSNALVGSTVTLLTQKGPLSSIDSSDIGALHLTASPAGRVAAQSAIDNSVAAGTNLNVDIVYPGDRGLGNEGSSVKGASKLSDVVAVWAGDEMDDEITTAREDS